MHMITVVRAGVGVLFFHERKRVGHAGAYDYGRSRWRAGFVFSQVRGSRPLPLLLHIVLVAGGSMNPPASRSAAGRR